MNAPHTAVLLVTVITILTGCASPQRGAANDREQELRRQLAESISMKDYGYTIKEVRFAPDHTKALVVFSHPDKQDGLDYSHRRPDWEFVLTADEFGRYRGGTIQPFYTPGTASTPRVDITVDFLSHARVAEERSEPAMTR